MKTTIKIFILALIIIGSSIFTGCITTENQDNTPTEQTIEEIAQALQYHFANNTLTQTIYNTIFSDDIKTLATLLQIQEIWNQIIAAYGEFIQITNTRSTQEQGYDVVYLTCEYNKLGFLDTRVVFNESKLVSGLQFVPTDLSDQYQPPDYANTENFTESNIAIGEGTPWALPANLTLPTGDGPFPAVILVHGSGPNDRDETVGANKPFKDLAWGLTTQGIAVLRYEKRTKYYATTIVNMLFELTVEDEVIEDSLQAITLLKNTTNIDPTQIYLLGHSLGGMLAPRIANQTTDLAGLILLAAPTRPLEDLMLNQTIYLAELDGTITEDEQEQIDATQENVTKIKTLNISTQEIILGAGLAYWQDLSTYNPVTTAQNIDLPMLILQGKRDYQVPYDIDFANWQTTFSTNTDVTFQLYENLNHLFISGTGPPTFSEYNTPGNIHEDVINDITTWITTT
jgi:dienelactone hydrolase